MAKRRERHRQTVGLGLVEADGAIEVLQPLLAEVSKEDVEILLLVLEQGLRGLGDEDLPAVPGRADPGRAVDCEARVPAAGATAWPVCRPIRTLICTPSRPGETGARAVLRRPREERRARWRRRRRRSRPGCRPRSRCGPRSRPQQTLMLLSTSTYRSRSCLTSRVEPSMSVKRKVTAPVGNSFMQRKACTVIVRKARGSTKASGGFRVSGYLRS